MEKMPKWLLMKQSRKSNTQSVCLVFFQEESDIFQINIHAGKDWVKVSQDTIDVLQKAVEVSKSSNGVFDVTTEVLTDYWRQLKKNQKKPIK